MVLDVMQLGADGATVGIFEGAFHGGSAPDVFHFLEDKTRVGSVPKDEGEPAPVVDAGLSVHGDVIDLVEGGAAGLQTVIDRLRGQPGPVFDPAEALLFGRGDEFAIAEKARRGVSVISV